MLLKMAKKQRSTSTSNQEFLVKSSKFPVCFAHDSPRN